MSFGRDRDLRSADALAAPAAVCPTAAGANWRRPGIASESDRAGPAASKMLAGASAVANDTRHDGWPPTGTNE